MAKNIFDNFTWTDRKSRTLYSPSNAGAPEPVGYESGRIGGLSALGRALSGIAAPFAGDYQYAERMNAQDLRSQQADQEFQALLMKNALSKQELAIKQSDKKDSDKFQAAYAAALLSGAGLNPQEYGYGSSATSSQSLLPPPGQSSELGGLNTMMLPRVDKNGKVSLSSRINPLSLDSAKKMQGDSLDAAQTTSRDIAQFNMLGDTLKGLTGYYDQASKGGFAGDKLKAGFGNLITEGYLPKGIYDKVISTDQKEGLKGVSAFVAGRNELITKLQPMLSQQFGKEGTTRIMDSMLKMTNKEIGSLDQPRDAFIARSKATMKNMHRFIKGSADYASRLGIDANKLANMKPEDVDSFVKGAITSTSLSEKDDKSLEDYLNKMTEQQTGSSEGSFSDLKNMAKQELLKRKNRK
jgi:hypothetical protein